MKGAINGLLVVLVAWLAVASAITNDLVSLVLIWATWVGVSMLCSDQLSTKKEGELNE